MAGALVLITGTGRSGTSTMSGALHHLGLYVPGPYLGANATNPKGFYESRWAVKFHNRLTERAGINIFDSRPGAFDRAQAAVTPQARARLVAFLREHAKTSDQVVIKDPRTVWVQRLWREAADEAGLEIRYISMLRHPAEVVGSRTTYYAGADVGEAKKRRYAIFNVARWVNNSLISERETRGFPRAFVRYTDLLQDWRPVLRGVAEDLDLRLNADLSTAQHHDVDDFIEPGLRRHTVTWEELAVPGALQEVAQAVWDQHQVLADSRGVDREASQALDRLAQDFQRVLDDAHAVSHDAIVEAKDGARRQLRDELDAKAQEEATHSRALGDDDLAEVPGRDLLRAAARKAWRRMGRSQ